MKRNCEIRRVLFYVSFWKCRALLCTPGVKAFHFTNMRHKMDQLGHISCTYVDCKQRLSIYKWDTPHNVGSLHDTVYWCIVWVGVWHRVVWLVSNHSFILQSVLRQHHSLFQSEFCTECDLVLPLSICSILSFPLCNPVSAYVFFPFLPSLNSSLYLPFNNVYQKPVPTQDVTNPVSLPTFYCM